MDLAEAKRLLDEKDHCTTDRIDIRNAIQRNLANQVPALVTEVELLRIQVAELPAEPKPESSRGFGKVPRGFIEALQKRDDPFSHAFASVILCFPEPPSYEDIWVIFDEAVAALELIEAKLKQSRFRNV